MPTTDPDRCPATKDGGEGYRITRRLRCQLPVGHKGQCDYHRRGGQGGSHDRWWGANPRPVGWIDDLTHQAMRHEIGRLRTLCDDHDIDWRTDATTPDWAPRITPARPWA